MSLESEFSAYLARLYTAAYDTLNTDVADVIKEEMSRHVHEDVYDAYEPLVNKRREDSGGLSDVRNYSAQVKVEAAGEMELSVKNETPFQTGADVQSGMTLSEVVQSGAENFRMPFPREYVEKTQEDVDAGMGALAFIYGIRRRGF